MWTITFTLPGALPSTCPYLLKRFLGGLTAAVGRALSSIIVVRSEPAFQSRKPDSVLNLNIRSCFSNL
jgi:hypothetical protein